MASARLRFEVDKGTAQLRVVLVDAKDLPLLGQAMNLHARLHIHPAEVTPHISEALFNSRNHMPHEFKKISKLYQPNLSPVFNEV